MGHTKLCMLLLFSACTLADPSTEVIREEAGEVSCPLATRFKTFRKYIYHYSAKSTNGVAGADNTKNGPKISCKVELEVPQTCTFVLHTTECVLSEATDVDAEGMPVYTPSPGTETFQAAMEKSPLSFVVEQLTKVSIYPEKDEPENVVNIKRGIISALLVPVIEQEYNTEMASIHGVCPTELTVNSKKDIDTDVTVFRDLRLCSHFYPRSLPTSPLSLLPGLNGLLSRLIRSSQTCNYQFDNRKKHMTETLCTELYIFNPFSNEAQYDITSEVKQLLTLVDTVKSNNRIFNTDERLEKMLFPDEVEDRSFSQDKENIVTSMKTLNELTHLGRNKERAHLFHKLVSQIRGLKNESLSSVIVEMMEISKAMTWQALLQCGTSECTSSILQVLRSFNGPAWEVDALVYALGLLPQPTPQRLRDLLSMAEHRQSKPIMYALANTVKKFPYKPVIREVIEVAEFMKFMLGDCTGDEDKTFLTLRVIGVMGKHMEGFPFLKSSLLTCMSQRDASLSVQKSAIQAFRLMEIDSDVTNTLLQQYQDTEAPAQKRIAAYLMLMRKPGIAEELLNTLKKEKNQQVSSFVASHIANLLDTADPKLQTTKEYITKALESEDFSAMAIKNLSHNYKIGVPSVGSVESNVIFDSASYMPREVMLKTTLDIFNTELLEVGLESKGFEPTIEALFGQNGFFPDTISKAIYWANEQGSSQISKVLEKLIAPFQGSRKKREVTLNIMEQIKEIFGNIKQALKFLEENKADTKAMAYLQLLGTELGYMKTSELNGILENIMAYTNVFYKDILSMPIQKLLSGTDNELFVHYMFLDKAFTLPTSSGLPLKFSLAGVFAPGVTGGLKFARGMKQLSFRPSMGIEFVTQMGIYLPEFMEAGIRMHTNMYHEGGLDAKITLGANQVKLSIPVSKEHTQLISISNELFSFTSTMEKKVSPNLGDKTDSKECNPIFPGMKYCTILQYYNNPYYLINRDSRFALEIQPTGDVSEYTAALTYELLREGKEGRHKVDSLVVSFKAEGDRPTEATATVKYNRNKNIFTSELQIPYFDVDAGIKMAVMDSIGKGKNTQGITLDISNRKSLQLSIFGRSRLESIEDGMLELGMAIPAAQMSASAIASIKNVNGLVLQLETAFNIPETTSAQQAILRCDENKAELEIKSDVNSEVAKLMPNINKYRTQLQTFIDDILDQQVAKTDMKLRHIVSKAIEAGHIWIEKFGQDIPYLKNLKGKSAIPELTLPSLPENLFLKSDALFRYQFNKGKIFFSLPLPLGGRSSAELKIPSTLTLPHISVPFLGIEVPETKHRIPSFIVPQSFDFSLPMIGMAEVSAKVKSNLYDWEGSVSGGNYTLDVPSYIATYKVMATSPLTLLSYNVEGTALVTGTLDDTLKYLVNGSLNHSFLDSSFSVLEIMSASDKLRTTYKFEASSPFGLQTSLYCSTQSAASHSEFTAHTSGDGAFKIGPLYANTNYTESFTIDLLKGEGKGESILKFDSSLIQGQTETKGQYRNRELSIVSKTSAQNDALKHTAEVKYKNGQLSLKSDASATVLGKSVGFHSNLQMTKDKASLKIETNADDATNRAYSIVLGSLTGDKLEVNTDGAINFENIKGTHKGTLTLGVTGIASSCTMMLLSSSVTLDKAFNAEIDRSGASLSFITKVSSLDNTAELNVKGKIAAAEMYLNSIFKSNMFDSDTRNTMNLALNKQGLTLYNTMTGTLQKMRTESTHNLELTLWTLALQSKTDCYICDGASYGHDISVNMRPFVTSVSLKNKIEMFDLSVSNEGHLKMEPFKIDATGSITGKYEEDNTIKTTCGVSLSELTGSIKCDSNGAILDSQISHSFDLEFAGLQSVFKSETHLNSKALRLENAIRTMAMPFSLTVDAILNSDGSVNFYGKHTGQLYSKFLLKAEPFAIAKSHDWRASATHILPNGDSAETHFENKFDGLLIPNEQSMSWRIKSKLNNHAYNQEVSIYNKEADMGVQVSGVLQTNLFSNAAESTDILLGNQEFSISGFLKYDKNSECHFIELPFIEGLPIAFEKMKTTVVSILEQLQQYLNGLDVNDLVRQFRENLDKVPQKVADFIEEYDLENKLNMAKDKIVSLAKDYAVTLDDLEASLDNLKIASGKVLIDLAVKIRDLKSQIKYFIESDSWSKILKDIGDELKAFDERYSISRIILKVIIAIEDVTGQIDLQKLHDGSMAWLKKLDANYKIRAKIHEKISELKQAIESFDMIIFIQDVIDHVRTNLAEYVNQLSDYIPSDDIEQGIDSMKDVIVNWIEEYEIVEKINYIYSKIGELFQRYQIEKRMEVLVQQTMILVQQFKIQDTVQAIVDTLKAIPIEQFSDVVMQQLHVIINKLKLFNIKQNIDLLKEFIKKTIDFLKTFNYNKFVVEANEKINKVRNYINEQIKVYEIPQKIEATRAFLKKMQYDFYSYLEQLKNTKVAELYRMIKGIIDSTAYKDIKLKIQDMLEDMRQRISDMDIREEIQVYLHRASESYTNMIAYILSQFKSLIETIRKVSEDQEILDQILKAVEGVFNSIKMAQIDIQAFTLTFTDLQVPAIQINMDRLQYVTIPSVITVPAFKVLDVIDVPSVTIKFESIKQKIIEFIDQIRNLEIPELDPEATFGDLRVLYFFNLPDCTFPEIKLIEIRIPEMNIPKLNLENFDITMLPIPEVKLPDIQFEPCIPAFGKLYGEFRLNSPYYTMMTEAAIQNTTTKSSEPQFKATLSSQAKSTIEVLGYSLDAVLQIEARQMKKMVISEIIKASNKAFTMNHEGSLVFTGPSAEAKVKTTAKVTTEMYKADLVNNIGVALKNGISMTMNTNYNHQLNIPSLEVSSQATIRKTAEARFDSGTISVTCRNVGDGKWSVKDYSDEGIHKSTLEFSVNTGTAKLTFDGETNSKILKMKQSVKAESVILSHITFDVSAETETPFMKTSVMKLVGKAGMEDLIIEVIASHNAELTGRVSGTLSNTCEFLAQPFEITLDCKNKGNTKVIFPLKLTGKIDLQHDYKMILNSETQHASWVGLARFNQYKYNHNFTLDNRETDSGVYVSVDGEANLEFLTVPITIPEMTVPYFDARTPTIKDISMWEDLGLKKLLNTPHQSLDIDFKFQYQKNSDKHTFDLDLEPIYKSINENAKVFGAHFKLGRDKIFDTLTNSYNQARTQFERFNIDPSNQPPRYFKVPGYTVPILNIEVSAFRAELPAVSYFLPKEVSTPSFKVPLIGFSVPSYTLVLPSLELPVLHVPETIRGLTLPSFTLPDIQNSIMIPALGNLTYDFSFKSPVITLTSNGGLYNQSDIVLKLGASSTSVFEHLNGKLDGTSSITRKRCLKVATALALEHKNAQYMHDSSFSLTKRNIEASIENVFKIDLPVFTLELNQKLSGNTKSKPNLSSNMKLQYTYSLLPLKSEGKGIVNHDLELESLSSYFSLESSLKGKTDGTLMDTGRFSESFSNEATIYVNINGLRSTVKADITSEAEYKKAKIWNLDITENFELETSLKRIYATMNYTNHNELNIKTFATNGKHSAKGTIELVPLKMLTASFYADVSQPSSHGLASMLTNVDLDVSVDKQKLVWSSKEQLASIKHSSEILLSNDETEIRMEITESVEGHVAFLKSIKLPVYQKSLWNVLKFDETTSTDKLQFLNVATHLVYTKSMAGTLFELPATLFENGIIFNIPEITLSVPDWLKQIPQIIKEVDPRIENAEVPNSISLPPVMTIPTFVIPFTDLQVPFSTFDLQNVQIPNVIRASSFNIIVPGLPKVRIPSFEVDIKYIREKMAHLLVKFPKYDITVLPFTLPKSFTFGRHTISLDDIVKTVCQFEMPTITIPEQKLEIPEMSLYLPVSVFIPSFGALSTTVKVSSPIYNNTWTARMENKKPGFVYTLKSSCTSTMMFLGYDLEAVTSVSLDNGAVILDGKCTLSHSDVKLNWKHDLQQNLRIKREEPSASRPHRHTLDVDVMSQTFTNMRFRYASHSNGITSSVSSPAGLVGFQFTKRSPSQYYGKFFTRSLSSADKDTDLLTFRVILKNSEKLNIQTSWQLKELSDTVNEFKARLPSITAAIHDFVNKYHKAHFGIDLNTAALKINNGIKRNIDRAYSELPKAFDAIQNSAEQLSQQSKDLLKNTMKSMPGIDFQDMISGASNNVKELLHNYETNVRVLFDAIIKFLSETKFHLPGLDEKLTGQEMYYKMRRALSMAIKRAASRFTGLMETIADTVASYITGINFSLPGTHVIFSGRDMMTNLKSGVKSAQDQIIKVMKKWEGMRLEKVLQNVSEFVQQCIQKAREFISSLKAESLQDLYSHLNGIYTEARNTPVVQEITKQIQTTRTNAADYKVKAQLKVQDFYNEMSMERLNSEMDELISVLEKHLRATIEASIEYAKKASQHTQPYIKVTNKKLDMDIPLPFYWNSFSEWPSLT